MSPRMNPGNEDGPAAGLKSWSYGDLRAACDRGAYPCSVIRAASGRVNYLFGVSPDRLALLGREARARRTGFLLLGSRVSGPRLRQRSLHPALQSCLPLQTRARGASAVFPGVAGVDIDKTAIKDFGPADPRTSDLSVILVDPRRSPGEMRDLAVALETAFASMGWGFPVRFFAELDGTAHRSEEEFLTTGERHLRSLLPAGAGFSPAELRQAMRELYCTVNLPRRTFTLEDLRNGALTALLFSASFSLGLGFHAVLVPVGFAFGFLGRYLARLRALVAFSLGDGIPANAAALLLDACIGAAVMAGIINPAAGLGLAPGNIAAASLSHTLAKGSLRLFLDKLYSTGNERRQARGVAVVAAVNFLQGAVTSFVYAGSRPALALQALACLLGLYLLFGPRAPSRTGSS